MNGLPSPPAKRPVQQHAIDQLHGDASQVKPKRLRVRWELWLGFVIWTALAAAAYAVYSGAINLPERYRVYYPWTPLDVLATPNFLTPYKLARARNDPVACLSALSRSGMQYQELPDRVTGPDCGFENAVRVQTASIRLGTPLTLSCPMALSFSMWERHALQAAAGQRFGEAVVAVEHLGSYVCRNVNTGEGAAPRAASGNRSRHATANALDIASLTLASGKRITVLKDFQRRDADVPATPESLFMNDVQAGACSYFKGVLGPNYNAVHRDHLHLETGGFSICR